MSFSFPKKWTDKFYVFVTPRGTFARNQWGESFTKDVGDAEKSFTFEDACQKAEKMNSRLGKVVVRTDLAANYMEVHWGFSVDGGDIACVEKYFPPGTMILSEVPPEEYFRHASSPTNMAFENPEIAWATLKNYTLHNLKFYVERVDEYKSHLAACESALKGEKPKNVVSIKKDKA